MNIKKRKSNVQGKSPKLLRGNKYRQTLEALFIEGSRMAGADALGVVRALKGNGVSSVVIGGLVVGCHTGRPRATQDVDVIIDSNGLNRQAILALGKVVGSKKVEKHPSFISFIKSTAVGDREVLDIITSKSGSYGLVFDNCIAIKIDGTQIFLPSVEMMVVLKYTAAVNPIRGKAKQAQDWADIYAMIEANPNLRVSLVEVLADLVVPGWGQDLKNRIRFHKE